MMETTANEVLDKHLNIMLEGHEEKYFTLKEMQAQPEYKSVLNAMEEYAEAKLKNHGVIGDVMKCDYCLKETVCNCCEKCHEDSLSD